MRLASFAYEGADRVGAEIDDGHVIDLSEALAAAEIGPAPADMLSLIRGGETTLAAIRTVVDLARSNPDAVPRIPLGDIRWHPPVRRPGKVLGVAMNNSAADDRKVSAPDHPLFFMKPATCLLGHNEPVVVRDHYGRLHPEPELAVIVGRTIKDYDPRDGDAAVFGYAVFDDLTGNDMRSQDRVHYFALYPDPNDPDQVTRVEQHLSYTARYKGTDGFGPFGPWLVTKDEVPDPQNLAMTLDVSGTRRQTGSTSTMIFGVKTIVAHVSAHMALLPGDIILTGTPPGVGAGHKPKPVFLRAGDVMTVSIEGLGEQRQEVVPFD